MMSSPDAALDEQFHKTVVAVEKRLQLLGRLPQVRIKAWLGKLKESTSNLTWKRNRNMYARLLLEQLRAGCLEVPFNGMPPEGGLPTLPAYLTYRFMSPPRLRNSCPGANWCEDFSPPRPHSAGAYGAFGPGSPARFHDYTAAMPLPTQHSGAAAGVVPPSHLSALSPIRCGPPRQGCLPGQLQQQWPATAGPADSPAVAAAAGGKRANGRGNPNSPPAYLQQQERGSGAGLAVNSSGGGAAAGGLRRCPGSPGAAGLLDAAVALAAEVEAGRGDAAVLDSRLRFAEDKLLQQEAELVRLQGQAAAARRRVKAVTAATLAELVERYGSAAAAWDSPTRQGSPSSPVKPVDATGGPAGGEASLRLVDGSSSRRVLMQQLEEAQLATNMILEQLQWTNHD